MAVTELKWGVLEWADCPNCGDTVEVRTRPHVGDDICFDGDPVRCVSCSYRGTVTADEDGAALSLGNLYEIGAI